MLRKCSIGSIILVCCASVLALGLLAYIGFYGRYWADDWCYNRDFQNLGVLGSLRGYFFTGQNALRGYSTNRYALTLLSGLLYLPGLAGLQILATLIISLWLSGLFWMLFNLSKLYRPFARFAVFPSAVFLLCFMLYLSPQRFQILYWRSGVHYSFTIIAGLFIIALILSQMIADHAGRATNYLIAVLAFIAGGLSETGCVYLFCALILLLASAWIGKRKQWTWAQRSFSGILTACLALLASMIVLIISPSNDRYQSMSVRPASLTMVPFLSLRFSLDFIVDSFKSLPLPNLVLMAFFMAMAILQELFSPATRSPTTFRKTFAIIMITVIVIFLLIAAIQAPTVYFYKSVPEPRAQSLSWFTLLIGLAIIAWVLGHFLIESWNVKNWIQLAAILSITLCAIYTARLSVNNLADLALFKVRANLWDQRDAALRTAQAQGATRADAIAIDTKGWGVEDMLITGKQMNGQWVSNCFSQYYGLDAVRAVPP
ncbi:MAG TPA: hypothetical protein VLX61_07185 [Anaerolineales bacterium]|nr:hypothetical protein [Anaerolineales bacterium]